ncbi:MAG TPA: UDP-N-acetylmuramoyl-L-alanyl-D-glutamate--2,6-diaminopimelate ligase [Gemmatimonadaceae bacterium]|nr:UDP-N-acetylmuramoyl-L-alanyl-D-glutamate--2,6-diaminopimelate ligase [Gemmatimonadaceae bacterium]
MTRHHDESGSEISTATLRDALDRAGLLVDVAGELPATVTGVSDDSRRITPGALFVAVRGSVHDGHDHLAGAAAAGAAMAIVEEPGRTALPQLVVRDGRRAAAIAAAEAYGRPAERLALIAVTGTNGKTTTVGMLRHLLDSPERPAASIGTLGVLVGGEARPLPGGAGLTTPGPVELQRVLRALVDAGVATVAMEVSSHSLDQRRVDGLLFVAAVFTNFTRDHLDYHETMEAYFLAKARLVAQLDADGVAVVNADEEAWRELLPAGRTVRFSGLGTPDAEVAAEGPRYGPRGTECTLRFGPERVPARVPLVGDFNVVNACGAAAAAWALGHAPAQIAERLATLPQVPGRLEVLSERPLVLRDYAHTPDALERAVRAVRPFVAGRLLLVFGCGGDRDRGKRPEMGRIAAREADVVYVTSDNPRTEDPERILDDIIAGMDGAPCERIEDRRAAIAAAIAAADPRRDAVLLAGKGHETYQIRGTTRLPFDEAAIVRELTAALPRPAGPADASHPSGGEGTA